MNYVDHPTLATLLLQVFHTAQNVNNKPEVSSDTSSFSEIGLKIFPSFPLSQATSNTHIWGTFLSTKYHPENLWWGKHQHEHVTCLAHKFLLLCKSHGSARAAQGSYSTPGTAMLKCFAGYMLFLEEQLEARATGLTICLFDMQQLHIADLED